MESSLDDPEIKNSVVRRKEAGMLLNIKETATPGSITLNSIK